MAKAKRKKKEERAIFVEKLTLDKTNFTILGIGILLIVIGYIIMASGDTYSFRSITLAPIILLVGYLIIIPIAILYKRKNR